MIATFRRAHWGLAALIAVSISNLVYATGPLDTGGFEGYPTGPLVNSNGWVGVSSAGSTNVISGATVQTDIVIGSKAVRVDRVGGVDNHWAVPFGGSSPTLPTNRFNPGLPHRAGAGAGLAADDDPVDALEH